MAPHPKGAETDVTPPDGRGLWEVAWRRKALVLLLTALTASLAGVYYVLSKPVYQASAQVLVVTKRPDAVTGVESRQLTQEDYVATHQVLIRSPLVVERACNKHRLGELPSLAPLKDRLVEEVIRALTVSRGKGPSGAADNVLTLAFRCTNAADAAAVLDAVIGSYKEFLDETYRDLSSGSLKLIAQARDVLQKELNDKEAAYRKFREQSPMLVFKGKDGASLRQDRLAGIEAKRAVLLVRRAELQAQLAVLDAGPGDGGREALLALIASWGQGEAPGAAPKLTLQDQLHPLLMEEQKLLASRGANHPDVVALRRRIEVTRNFLAGPSAPWRQAAGKGASADSVALYRTYCRQQLKHGEVAEGLLAGLAQKEQDGARQFIAAEVQDTALRADIDRRQRLYDTVVKQLQQVDLARGVGGYDARVIAPPLAGKKVQPSALQIFPAALLLGALAGLGLAYLAEVRDRSFRTADEVRRALGLPVIGHVPFFKPQGKGRQAAAPGHPDPMLCTRHRPASPEAEAYRGVRTALLFGAAGAGRKVIQVTSAAQSDGKTVLAANLAVSIAQSGKRVLLIDADLRKPHQHRLFGLEPGPGLAGVLAGTAELDAALLPGGVPGLSVLPGGPRPDNPAELLTAPRFEEVLRCLRGRYDFILVDTPALLAVTDPVIVAPRVDGVLLNVRAGANGRPPAERARALLGDLGVPIVGVVINAMDHHGRADAAYFGASYSLSYGASADEVVSARPAAIR